MAGSTGTNGTDKLHRTIGHRHVPVLRHRFGMGKHNRTVADGIDCAGGLSVSDNVQPAVAFRFQIRTIGMDMADADLWEMAKDKIDF